MQTIARMQGLTKRYGEFVAVEGLDLQILQGEVFALLGPNGAGKTTTIRMLMGTLQPTGGSACVNGFDCFAERAQVMRHVGYLPDEPVFYDYLTGREILQFVADMRGLPARETAELLGPLLEQLDLAEAMGEYAVNYSRGMKKKLALACALLHQPDLLILDEPTNGLDPYATRAVHELIRRHVASGMSVFFSTHLLDQAERLCDRAGILYRGKLAAVGRLEELRASLAVGGSLEEIFFSVTSGAGMAGNGQAGRPTGASSGDAERPS